MKSTATTSRTISAALIAAAAAAASTPASAADNRLHDIAHTQQRLSNAIAEGRRDGSLTWYERYILQAEQSRIAKLEADALADGRLTPEEYRTIRDAQAQSARHIIHERRDTDVRGFWWRLFR